MEPNIIVFIGGTIAGAIVAHIYNRVAYQDLQEDYAQALFDMQAIEADSLRLIEERREARDAVIVLVAQRDELQRKLAACEATMKACTVASINTKRVKEII